MYQIETGTIDDLNMCNMHIHTIVDSPYMKKSDLSKEWKEITHGSYIVEVKRCFDSHGALTYLTGHMCKRVGYPRNRELINKALKHTRLVQLYGDTAGEGLDLQQSVCPDCGGLGGLVSEFDALYYDALCAL